MRLTHHLVVALAILPGSLAIDSKKSAIVSFDDGTPKSVIEEAKNSILRAGGKITHEYSLIKGFAVIAPEKALQSMQGQSSEHGMRVEDDGSATTQ
ncbi:hypothetical protein HRG_007848 [Hirsutella rhossiliensis]|uniref:Inhibitor I9 domain-containing protein n=1 Tax=Hirsutella rhossiliensis TaxID=111463 RepID=A0A9P8SGN7_9HYPO|nr:uncharacterized protein HRG_07848 [Hirsutella rhossiliensis]KAH0960695.1 hypothetical protein HRG_07848 [Hirsutella rhossiliensis]